MTTPAEKKTKRRLGEGVMTLISLVPHGANDVRAIFKRAGAQEWTGLSKMDDEGLLTSLVYLVDQADTQGDAASAAAVKSYCHNFIPNMQGSGIDVLHNGQPLSPDQAHLCENFIVQKGDPRFVGMTDTRGKSVDPTGAWATVIKILDPAFRKLYKTGEWFGVSMFGSAVIEPSFSKQHPNHQNHMDEAKMAELLKTFGNDLGAKIVEGLEKALAPKPAEPVTKVVFEGDPTNPADIAKHKDTLFLASCDLTSLQGIAKWEAYLAKQAADAAKAEAAKQAKGEDVEAVKKELAAVQARLEKATKASANPADVNKTDGGTLADKLARGQERAARLKKMNLL